MPANQPKSPDDVKRHHLIKYLHIASLWVQLGVPLERITRLLAHLARATDG